MRCNWTWTYRRPGPIHPKMNRDRSHRSVSIAAKTISNAIGKSLGSNAEHADRMLECRNDVIPPQIGCHGSSSCCYITMGKGGQKGGQISSISLTGVVGRQASWIFRQRYDPNT